MIKLKSPCIINGLHVTEIHVNAGINSSIAPTINAVYALCHKPETITEPQITQDNAPMPFWETHGRCEANNANWSPKTIQLLSDLLMSMEEDLLPLHFVIDEPKEEIDDDDTFLGGEEATPQI